MSCVPCIMVNDNFYRHREGAVREWWSGHYVRCLVNFGPSGRWEVLSVDGLIEFIVKFGKING